jgi:signal transduction histidine kinase
VSESEGWLEFMIADSGQGFDPSRPTDGTGLQKMRDRLEALGGSLEVESVPGRGTRILGRVPANEAAEMAASLEPVG